MEAPEHLLLIIGDVEKEQAHDIVYSLHVAYFVVVISVSFKHVVKFVIALQMVFLPEVKLSKCAVVVFIYLVLSLMVGKIFELLIQIF